MIFKINAFSANYVSKKSKLSDVIDESNVKEL